MSLPEQGQSSPGTLESSILYLDLSCSPSHCGYCGSRGSLSQGMWAERMTVGDYQALLDRGWRRSGRYVYKPCMATTCCPLYTIRCRANQYTPTKSQKKVVRKVQNFIKSDKKPKEDAPEPVNSGVVSSHSKPDTISGSSMKEPGVEVSKDHPAASPAEAGQGKRVEGLKKAKILRRERYLEKLVKAGIEPPRTQDKIKQKNISHLVPDKNYFAMNVKLGQSEANSAHKFELRLVKADLTDKEFMSSFQESYQVYQRYQTIVHKDKPSDCDINTFAGFLCDSPLLYQDQESGRKVFGAFHQQYLIDGAIVAVGVVDILPNSLSSVYLYYDPAWWGQGSNLSPGTYTAIREVQLTQELGLPYYYMGYYIHSCPKMRYKGRFLPADLLAPTTLSWHSIEQCLPQLEAAKFSTFAGVPATDQSTAQHSLDVGKVRLSVNNMLTTYDKWKVIGGDSEEVVQYHALVGQALSESLVLKWGGGPDEDSESDSSDSDN